MSGFPHASRTFEKRTVLTTRGISRPKSRQDGTSAVVPNSRNYGGQEARQVLSQGNPLPQREPAIGRWTWTDSSAFLGPYRKRSCPRTDSVAAGQPQRS